MNSGGRPAPNLKTPFTWSFWYRPTLEEDNRVAAPEADAHLAQSKKKSMKNAVDDRYSGARRETPPRPNKTNTQTHLPFKADASDQEVECRNYCDLQW